MSKNKVIISLSLLLALSSAGCGNKSINNASNLRTDNPLVAYIPSTAAIAAELNRVPAPIIDKINRDIMEDAMERKSVFESRMENEIYSIQFNRYKEVYEELSAELEVESSEHLTNQIAYYEPLAQRYDDFLATCWTNPSIESLRALAKDIDCSSAQNQNDCTCLYANAMRESLFYDRDDNIDFSEELKSFIEEYDSIMMLGDSLDDTLVKYGFLPLDQTKAVAYVDDHGLTFHVTIADSELAQQGIEIFLSDFFHERITDHVNGWAYMSSNVEPVIVAARADDGLLTLSVVSSLQELAEVPHKAAKPFDRSKFLENAAVANYWMDNSALYRALVQQPFSRGSDNDEVRRYCWKDEHEAECEQYYEDGNLDELMHKLGYSVWSDDVCIQEVESLWGGIKTVVAVFNAADDGTLSLNIKYPIESKETSEYIAGLVVPHDIHYTDSEEMAGSVGINLKKVFMSLMELLIKQYKCTPLANIVSEVSVLFNDLRRIEPQLLSTTVVEGIFDLSDRRLIFHSVGNPMEWMDAMDIHNVPQEGQLGGDYGVVYYKGQEFFMSDHKVDLTLLKPVRQSSSFIEGTLNKNATRYIYNRMFTRLDLNAYYENDAINVDITSKLNMDAHTNEDDE